MRRPPPTARRAPQLLDRLQLRADRRELGFGGRDLLLLGPRGDRLLGLPLRLEHLGFVEVGRTNRGVGEDVDVVRLHLEDAALHVHELLVLLAWHLDAHRPRLDLRDQRRVARVDAELAHDAGQHHELRVAGVDGLFGTDDVDSNGGHYGSRRVTNDP